MPGVQEEAAPQGVRQHRHHVQGLGLLQDRQPVGLVVVGRVHLVDRDGDTKTDTKKDEPKTEKKPEKAEKKKDAAASSTTPAA